MDSLFQFDVLVILLVALVSVLTLCKSFLKYRNVGETRKLPPGPSKLPLIGNMHQLVGGGLPHHILREMARKHGPLMQLQVGEIPIVIVSSAILAKEVFKTQDSVFANRPQLLAFKTLLYDGKDIAGCAYNDYWRQMRKIFVHELVNAKTVRSLASIRKDEGDRLISMARLLKAGESFNLTEAVSRYTMSVVCRAAFGSDCKDHEVFIKLVLQVTCLLGGFDLADLFPSFKFLPYLSTKLPKMLKVHRKIDTFIDGIIMEHIQKFDSTRKSNVDERAGEEDLVDILLRVKDDTSNLKFPITNFNIKAMIFDVFVGGTESSTTVTVWAMAELLRNPTVMEKAQREIREAFKGKESIDEASISQLKYLNLVIKETFRLHPPAPFLVPRESLQDCVIDKYNIPARTKLLVNVWAIGRDATFWLDPESFVPERFEDNSIDFNGFNFELIPFGAGRRICPGIPFALANINLTLALLLYHFDWDLPSGLKPENLDMSEIDGITARRKIDLCLIPTLRYVFTQDQLK